MKFARFWIRLLGDDPGEGFTALARPLTGDTEVRVVPGADPVVLLNATARLVAEFTPWGRFPVIQPDPGTPFDRPFILIGGPLPSSPVQFQGARLVAGAGPGSVIRWVGGPVRGGLPGMVVSVVGDPGQPMLGDFGRECAQVITPAGDFAVVGRGEVFVATPARKGAG
jgi:hypothetical protein